MIISSSIGINSWMMRQSSGDSTPQSILGANLKYLAYVESVGDPFSIDSGLLEKFQYNIANSDRIGGLIDRTLAGIDQSTYTSIFTSSVDSWAPTSSVSLTFNETIGGESGWLKLTSTGAVGQKYATLPITIAGRNFRVRYKYFIPSTNLGADSAQLIGHGGGFYTGDTVANQQANLDTILSFDGNVFGATVNTIRFQMLDNGSTTIGFSGEELYIKDIIVERLNGPAFGQYVNNAWPTFNNVSRLIVTDGVADYTYDHTLFAQTNGGDTQGTFYFKVRDDEGTGVTSVIFGCANAVTSASERFQVYFNSTNELIITTQTGSVPETHVFPTAVTRGTTSVITVKSNGSTFEAYQDDTNLGTPTNNNGRWMSYCTTLTMAEMGRRVGAAAATYDSWGYAAVIYANRATTTDEDTAMKTWINNL